jgi:hypothetical protein
VVEPLTRKVEPVSLTGETGNLVQPDTHAIHQESAAGAHEEKGPTRKVEEEQGQRGDGKAEGRLSERERQKGVSSFHLLTTWAESEHGMSYAEMNLVPKLKEFHYS